MHDHQNAVVKKPFFVSPAYPAIQHSLIHSTNPASLNYFSFSTAFPHTNSSCYLFVFSEIIRTPYYVEDISNPIGKKFSKFIHGRDLKF